MKIAIIGKGSVGSSLGKLLGPHHDVDFASRDSWDAVSNCEAVLLALPYVAVKDIVTNIKDSVVGKIVIDATNPLQANWSPLNVADEAGNVHSGAEAIQSLFPESIVVKCFNTVFADNMNEECLSKMKMTTFIACNDDNAGTLIQDVGKSIGFDAVKTGPLLTARYLEAMAHLNIQMAIGMSHGTNGTGFMYVGNEKE